MSTAVGSRSDLLRQRVICTLPLTLTVPRGNTNALRHGEFSVRHRRFIQALASIPEIRETLFKLAAHQRRKERLSQLAAAAVLARLFQRAGEAVLNPAANQVGNNQDFLDFLRTTGAALLAYTEYQSKIEDQSSEPRPPGGQQPTDRFLSP